MGSPSCCKKTIFGQLQHDWPSNGQSVCLYVSLPVCLCVSLYDFLSVCLSVLISATSHQPANMQFSLTDLFVQIPSKNCQSQIGRAGELKFWENVQPPRPCVTYHVSGVTCHVLGVTCHVSRVRCHVSHFSSSFKLVELVGGGFVINGTKFSLGLASGPGQVIVLMCLCMSLWF